MVSYTSYGVVRSRRLEGGSWTSARKRVSDSRTCSRGCARSLRNPSHVEGARGGRK